MKYRSRRPLQQMFNRALRHQWSAERLLVERIEERCAEEGIELSTREKRRLAECLGNATFDQLMFRRRGSRADRQISITLGDSDVEWLRKRLERIGGQLPGVIETVAEQIGQDLLTRLEAGWPREARLRSRGLGGFRKRLALVWGKPIDLLDLLITIAEESGSDANALLRRAARRKSPASVEVLTRLHARACQVAREIVTLLRAGFADGAMARWRTLHEISVMSEFIRVSGEEAATRYLHHQAVESKRAAVQFSQWCHVLGEKPLSKRQVDRIEKNFSDALKKYGESFKSEYGWAAESLKNKKPNFVDIEKAAGVDYLRPYYRMASHNVHANPKGILFRLGLTHDEVLLVGPSNTGLADPGLSAARSVSLITCNLVLMLPGLDSIVVAKVMLSISEKIGRLFVGAENRLDRAERRLRRLRREEPVVRGRSARKAKAAPGRT
jgi:hypothetical protein